MGEKIIKFKQFLYFIVNMDKRRLNRTFKEGLGGGILGAVVGAPGIGMAVGMYYANKDKIKKAVEKVI